MKAPLFEYPSFQYQIDDWEFKKKGLLKRIKEEKFVRTELQTFETDRQTNKKSYLCLLYTSPSPRDQRGSRMPSSA